METRNRRWVRMLAVSVFTLILSCSQGKINHSNYDIKFYKSKKYTSYATASIRCFEKDSNGQIPCGIDVNGVILIADSGKYNVNLTAGKITINAFFLGKKKTTINDLIMTSSDSVCVNFFLEDDDSYLHDQ